MKITNSEQDLPYTPEHYHYPTNAPDPFKLASYEHTKWVRCGHLNAAHSHVQA